MSDVISKRLFTVLIAGNEEGAVDLMRQKYYLKMNIILTMRVFFDKLAYLTYCVSLKYRIYFIR